MVVLSFHPVSGPTLRSIYRNLFQTWLEDFPAYSLTHHHQLAKVIFIKRENVNLTIFFPQTIGIEVDSIGNWTKYYPEGWYTQVDSPLGESIIHILYRDILEYWHETGENSPQFSPIMWTASVFPRGIRTRVIRALYSSLIFERDIRVWYPSVIFERDIRAWYPSVISELYIRALYSSVISKRDIQAWYSSVIFELEYHVVEGNAMINWLVTWYKSSSLIRQFTVIYYIIYSYSYWNQHHIAFNLHLDILVKCSMEIAPFGDQGG